jgi:hypothetical protein
MDAVQIVSVIVSAGLLVLVIDLVRRRILTEEYSFVWIACSVLLLVLSLWRGILHVLAAWLDVHYPPAVLLLVLMFFVFVASLSFSVIASRQRRQIERLIEDVAILRTRVRELAGDRDPQQRGS